MPLNPAWVGRAFATHEPYQVAQDKIREFATAIGDKNPAYHDVEAAKALGYPGLVAPPTFPIVVSLNAMAEAMVDPDLGLNYAFVVHGEQKFQYKRPLVAGDEFIVESTVADITSRGPNEYMTVSQELKTPAGESIATLTEVIVSRGTAAQQEA